MNHDWIQEAAREICDLQGTHILGDVMVAAIISRHLSGTEQSEKLATMREALEKIAGFAPGHGDVCEVIAKVARRALSQTSDANKESK